MSATTEATLDFDATVDPRLVWKLAPEQTFVTGWLRDTEREEFRIGIRVPRAHLRFSDTLNPYLDVMLLAEVANQAGVIVAAELLDVPLDSTFLLRRFAVELDPLKHNRIGPDSTGLMLTTDREGVFFKSRRTGRPPTGWMICQCAIEGRPSGTLEVQGVWVTDEMYQAFRRAGGNVEAEEDGHGVLDPEPETGRALPRNRAIARLEPAGEPRAYATTVLVDEEDPTYYERPLDHVPGLLLFEAAKQAATAAVCRERSVPASRVVIGSAELKFSRFAELYAPSRCRVELSEDLNTIDAELTQAGRRLSRMKLGASVLEGER
jgi:hypothetical protein